MTKGDFPLNRWRIRLDCVGKWSICVKVVQCDPYAESCIVSRCSLVPYYLVTIDKKSRHFNFVCL